MGELRTNAAPVLAVTLAEMKALLRIANSEEDALLAGIVRSAEGLCEAFTGRMLIERPVEEVLPASAAWTRLGAVPVRSVTGVAAIGENGTATALPADSYAIDIDAGATGWVRLLTPATDKRMRVSYSAGMAADPNGVPEALRHGIARLAAHLYAHRSPGGVAPDAAGPPAAVTALWRPWRRIPFG